MARIATYCAVVAVLWGCSRSAFESLGNLEGQSSGTPPSAPGGVAPDPAVAALARDPGDLFASGKPKDDCDHALRGSVGDTPLRRLTRLEYKNTVEDLFEMPFPFGDDLPIDGRVAVGRPGSVPPGQSQQPGGFASNAVGAATEDQVRSYAAAAKHIADTLIQDKQIEKRLTCTLQSGELGCAERFIRSLGARAFRRPLEEDQVMGLKKLYMIGASNGTFAAGLRLVLTAMLQSPYFLYHAEYKLDSAPSISAHPTTDDARGHDTLIAIDAYEIAARLSYFLWDSPPDLELSSFAESGALFRADVVREQALRMMADSKFEPTLRTFTESWLNIGSVSRADVTVMKQSFGEAALRETSRFVEFVLNSDDRTLQTLLTAGFSFPEAPLNGVYGIAVPPEYDGLSPLTLPPGERAGVLTQASTLFAMRPHQDSSPPTSRGLYVLRNFLCEDVVYEAEAHVRHAPRVRADQTDRQRLEVDTASGSCLGCHGKISPIGFAFESYDALGVWRTHDERGNPVNDLGGLAINDWQDGPARGAIELAKRIASSDAGRSCMVLQIERFALARQETLNDTCSLVSLAQRFEASGYNVRELMLDFVTQDLFRYRPGS